MRSWRKGKKRGGRIRASGKGRWGGNTRACLLHTRAGVGERLLQPRRGVDGCLLHTSHLTSKVSKLVQIIVRRTWRVYYRVEIAICRTRSWLDIVVGRRLDAKFAWDRLNIEGCRESSGLNVNVTGRSNDRVRSDLNRFA